jgi:chromosome partitioning protein
MSYLSSRSTCDVTATPPLGHLQSARGSTLRGRRRGEQGMRILATYGIKGGVGKTSAAVNLATLSALEGRRTLLWDLDPQGAAGFLLRVKPKVKGGSIGLLTGRRDLDDAVKATSVPGLDLLPADVTIRAADSALEDAKRPERQLGRLLKTVRDDYDIAVLDCPPGLSLLSENVFAAVDALLAPIIPTPLSLRTFDQLTAFLDEFEGPRPRVHPFFSMVDGRKRIHADIRAELEQRSTALLSAWIPAASAVERMGLTRQPLVVSDPTSVPAQAYRDLWAELVIKAWLPRAPAAGVMEPSPHAGPAGW